MKSSLFVQLAQSWLALNRLVTYHALKWRLRQRAHQAKYAPDPASMLYVAASALPYHISGYTTRTHEVIRALGAAGARVHVLTRPGYPWDRSDRCCDPEGDHTNVDNVEYRHVRSPRNHWPVILYAPLAAKAVMKVAMAKRVSVIQAASNHVSALPALLAARQLGIPFQYEMRGLWELTRISRMPEYEGSQAYNQGLQLEGLVARHADKLFVISEQLGNYAREHWGVDAKRMALLPNCVSPERFAVADACEVEPQSIGYAGSLIGYEGLDTLIEAVDRLARTGHPVRVHIIGDGEARAQLEAQVQRLGLAGRINFLGKLPPAAAREALARCAVVCLPRKPFKVCEIVPPIKLVEALAMGKPVIVPDLPVFRDEMGDAPAGWFFRAGDAADLARVIQTALANRAALSEMGGLARTYAVTKRSWDLFVPNVLGG